MLIMKRRAGEAILIGADIEIHIAQIGRSRVKIGIKAPREIPVIAEEVRRVEEENRAAARGPAALPALLAGVAKKAMPPVQGGSARSDEKGGR